MSYFNRWFVYFWVNIIVSSFYWWKVSSHVKMVSLVLFQYDNVRVSVIEKMHIISTALEEIFCIS